MTRKLFQLYVFVDNNLKNIVGIRKVLSSMQFVMVVSLENAQIVVVSLSVNYKHKKIV